jgi:hypothetical protein
VKQNNAQLNIALQDGFTGEEVVVRVDGEEVNRLEAQTAWEISLATSFALSVPRGSHRVEMEIPARNIQATRDIEIKDQLWVGVSVLGPNDVVWRESTDPFGYV